MEYKNEILGELDTMPTYLYRSISQSKQSPLKTLDFLLHGVAQLRSISCKQFVVAFLRLIVFELFKKGDIEF
jgi:hypothetical protein